MSNLRHRHTTASARRQPYRFASGLCALIALAGAARAHAEQNPIEDWARSIETKPARYLGPIVTFPETPPRPGARRRHALRSWDWPLEVHAAAGVSRARTQRALRALEHAYAWARAQQWPAATLPRRRLRRRGAFDLYFAPGGERLPEAGADDPIAWSRARCREHVRAARQRIAGRRARRCALFALVQAGLLGTIPPRRSVRRRVRRSRRGSRPASSAATTPRPKHSTRRSSAPLAATTNRSRSLAMWLAMLSRRHDRRQRRLRARHLRARAPAQRASERAARGTERLAGARGRARQGRRVDGRLGRGSRNRTHVRRERSTRIAASTSAAERTRARARRSGLEGTSGTPSAARSGFTRVRHRVHARRCACSAGRSRLHVWLRGDELARWSLVAVRLDAQGRELAAWPLRRAASRRAICRSSSRPTRRKSAGRHRRCPTARLAMRTRKPRSNLPPDPQQHRSLSSPAGARPALILQPLRQLPPFRPALDLIQRCRVRPKIPLPQRPTCPRSNLRCAANTSRIRSRMRRGSDKRPTISPKNSFTG